MTLTNKTEYPVVLEAFGFTEEEYTVSECEVITSSHQEERFRGQFSDTKIKVQPKEFPYVLEAWFQGVSEKSLEGKWTIENQKQLKRFVEKYPYRLFVVKRSKYIPPYQAAKKVTKSHQYSLWWSASKKALIWLFNHAIQILITLIAAYLVYRFGWNK